jgi:hypothetical protein
MVYGILLALSPWTVRNIRFDESLGLLRHGYDFDLCMQVRAAGRKVVTADLKVVHHHALALVTDHETWVEAYMRLAEKWEGRMPGPAVTEPDWKQRARRAEAGAAAARLQAASRLLQAYARAQEHDDSFKVLTDSLSWRITAPLRRLNAFRRGALGRRSSGPSGPSQSTLPPQVPAGAPEER